MLFQRTVDGHLKNYYTTNMGDAKGHAIGICMQNFKIFASDNRRL